MAGISYNYISCQGGNATNNPTKIIIYRLAAECNFAKLIGFPVTKECQDCQPAESECGTHEDAANTNNSNNQIYHDPFYSKHFRNLNPLKTNLKTSSEDEIHHCHVKCFHCNYDTSLTYLSPEDKPPLSTEGVKDLSSPSILARNSAVDHVSPPRKLRLRSRLPEYAGELKHDNTTGRSLQITKALVVGLRNADEAKSKEHAQCEKIMQEKQQSKAADGLLKKSSPVENSIDNSGPESSVSTTSFCSNTYHKLDNSSKSCPTEPDTSAMPSVSSCSSLDDIPDGIFEEDENLQILNSVNELGTMSCDDFPKFIPKPSDMMDMPQYLFNKADKYEWMTVQKVLFNQKKTGNNELRISKSCEALSLLKPHQKRKTIGNSKNLAKQQCLPNIRESKNLRATEQLNNRFNEVVNQAYIKTSCQENPHYRVNLYIDENMYKDCSAYKELQVTILESAIQSFFHPVESFLIEFHKDLQKFINSYVMKDDVWEKFPMAPCQQNTSYKACLILSPQAGALLRHSDMQVLVSIVDTLEIRRVQLCMLIDNNLNITS